tara:strand:+ start:849 stop:1568 length:720 start_codon:yes stop_codon:yes gene_type:complete
MQLLRDMLLRNAERRSCVLLWVEFLEAVKRERFLRKVFLCALVVGQVSFFPHNAKSNDINQCIYLENDLDRLSCYDKQSGRSFKENSSDRKSDWLIRTEKSKMTDQLNVFVTVDSNEEINCGWSRGEKVRLYLRCVENTTAVIFGTGCHMTSSDYSDYGDVTYRLDESKAKVASMTESTNNRSLGYWSGNKSIPFIKDLFGKSTLLARMTPFSENSFTASFNIKGAEAAVEKLRQSCNW